jgi:hypothetical protein
MPKSRKRKKKNAASGSVDWSGGPKPADRGRKDRRVLIVVLVLLLAGGGYWAWSWIGAQREFDALVADGQGALDGVVTDRNDGTGHVTGAISYASDFPTSGAHRPIWTTAGFYDAPQPKALLVHALEHGNIVIYYDQPTTEARGQMADWADLYSGQWDGVVVTPFRGLGAAVVLTAWRKTFRLDPWDASAAAAFIDAYRGRGPENPVR